MTRLSGALVVAVVLGGCAAPGDDPVESEQRSELVGESGCSAGMAACGRHCVDLANDRNHCGSCAVTCAAGQKCTAGACTSRAADPLLAFSSITPPVEVDGEPATTTCSEAAEPYAESPLTFGTAQVDVVFQTRANFFNVPYNWANSSFAWHSPTSTVAISGGVSTSDSWATTSGATGLEYVSRIVQPNGVAGTCVGIAATNANNLATGTWTFPMSCATATHASTADGPSIHFDMGASNLFVTETNFGISPVAVQLHLFPNCGAGQPGGAACPERAGSPVTVANATSHATVTVNPCTHDAVVGYRDASNRVVLGFYNVVGTQMGSTFVVDGSAPINVTSACASSGCAGDGVIARCGNACSTTDCGEAAGCARLASKVQVATKYRSSTNRCYAFVAYDGSCASGASTVMRSHFAVVDITSETAPTVAKAYISSACGTGTDNDFGSVSTANMFTEGVGWFYYHQPNGNACSTVFTGWTDTALALSQVASLGTISGPFPTMRFSAADGLGDYIGAVKRGLPGGPLVPVWSQPVQTSASCVACQASNWSLATFSTKVTP